MLGYGLQRWRSMMMILTWWVSIVRIGSRNSVFHFSMAEGVKEGSGSGL